MKEQIINILREHHGLRNREIASYLHVHRFKIMALLDEMERDGLLAKMCFTDPATMEFYEEYYIRA